MDDIQVAVPPSQASASNDALEHREHSPRSGGRRPVRGNDLAGQPVHVRRDVRKEEAVFVLSYAPERANELTRVGLAAA
jgi:hypothetical protein